jgi:hypothetical protein
LWNLPAASAPVLAAFLEDLIDTATHDEPVLVFSVTSLAARELARARHLMLTAITASSASSTPT